MKCFIYIFDVVYGIDEWWWKMIVAENRESANQKMIDKLLSDEVFEELIEISTKQQAIDYLDEENGGLTTVIEIPYLIKEE